ncbi:DegV family protein [Metamycoplasma cloacale]|nr:DegV family protein [Metamycoplasma cloacale]VEU79428.1 DegV family protein [Metamycoplasma cloacale]
MKYKIVIDSACDLSYQEALDLDWGFLPLDVEVDGQVYEIGKEMFLKQYAEIYRKNPKIKSLTNATPIGKAQAIIDQYIEEGYDKVIVYTMSKCLSSQNSNLKMLYKDNPKVYVVDSKKIAFLIVKDLMKFDVAMKKGIPFEKAVKIFDEEFETILLIPEFNDALVAGGRLSKPAAVIAKLLKIVPIIEFSKNGELVKYGMGHVFSKTVSKMIKELWEKFNDKKNIDKYEFVICNADNQKIDEIVKEVKEITQFKEVLCFELPTVITVHTGVGAITLSIAKIDPEIRENYHKYGQIK